MSRWSRRAVGFLAVYGVSAIVWFAQYPVSYGEFELLDLLFAALAFAFAGGAAVVLFTLDLPVLEVGWGVFTYSYFLRLLDGIAEGPETVESTLPGSIQIVGLAIILAGFVRSTTRLRSDLEERNERLEVLNRVLRHNLRNELTTVISSLEYFRDRADDDDAELADVAIESARHLAEMGGKARVIDDHLEEIGDTDYQTYDLTAVVASIVDDLREEYPAVDIDVTAPSTAQAIATRGVELAIENVIENACKHSDAADPAVSVTVDSDESTATRVTVSDNGSGIPSNELRALREHDESDLEHGTGLGLWFVIQLVDKSGGTTTFEYDGGQIVTIELPAPGRFSGWLRW